VKAPPATSPAVRRSMQGNRGRDTAPEVALRSAMHRLGLRFRKHVRPLPAMNATADAVFPRERVAVFLDGCFWHSCPAHRSEPKANRPYWAAKLARNRERDRQMTAALEDAGWLVLRFWEHDDPSEAALAVASAVVARRRTT
jgi:DNA mismatch endonuclease (patch repair protein)